MSLTCRFGYSCCCIFPNRYSRVCMTVLKKVRRVENSDLKSTLVVAESFRLLPLHNVQVQRPPLRLLCHNALPLLQQRMRISYVRLREHCPSILISFPSPALFPRNRHFGLLRLPRLFQSPPESLGCYPPSIL